MDYGFAVIKHSINEGECVMVPFFSLCGYFCTRELVDAYVAKMSETAGSNDKSWYEVRPAVQDLDGKVYVHVE